MGRSKYVIQNGDLAFAWRWINSKLANPLWLGERETYTAYQQFTQLGEGDAAGLNGWCEQWLGRRQWTQLKNAVRAGRKRSQGEPVKTITLSRNAWAILDYWARRDGVTLSEVIERRLGSGGAGS